VAYTVCCFAHTGCHQANPVRFHGHGFTVIAIFVEFFTYISQTVQCGLLTPVARKVEFISANCCRNINEDKSQIVSSLEMMYVFAHGMH